MLTEDEGIGRVVSLPGDVSGGGGEGNDRGHKGNERQRITHYWSEGVLSLL
jgi:hypothetical protein